jgi:hypothetical protein
MADAYPIRKQFDICARSEPQLELRLHWFGCALEARQGYIVAVKRQRSGTGRHVASIAYEVPVPLSQPRRRRGAQAPRG